MRHNNQSERHSVYVTRSEYRKMDRKTAYYMLKKIKRMPVLDTRITDRRSERSKRLSIFFLLSAIFATVGYIHAHTNVMTMLYSLAGMFTLTHHIICAVESYNYSPMTDEDMLKLKATVSPYTYVLDVMNDRLEGRSRLTQKEGDMLAAVCRKLSAHDSEEHTTNHNDMAELRSKKDDGCDQNQMLAYGVHHQYSTHHLTYAQYVVHDLRYETVPICIDANDGR